MKHLHVAFRIASDCFLRTFRISKASKAKTLADQEDALREIIEIPSVACFRNFHTLFMSDKNAQNI